MAYGRSWRHGSEMNREVNILAMLVYLHDFSDAKRTKCLRGKHSDAFQRSRADG